MKKRKLSLVFLLAMLSSIPSAKAENYSVTNLSADGSGSLLQAVNDLDSSGGSSNTITFYSGGTGTINLDSGLAITKNVDFLASNGKVTVSFKPDNSSQYGFAVNANTSLGLPANLTLTLSQAGPVYGIYNGADRQGGALTLNTLASDINVASTGGPGFAYGVYGQNAVVIESVSDTSAITVTTADGDGISAGIAAGQILKNEDGNPASSGYNGTLNITNAFNGRIKVTTVRSGSGDGTPGIGIGAENNVSIGSIGSSAVIDVTADGTAVGIGSYLGNLTVGDVYGNISAYSSGADSHGLIAQNLTIGSRLGATIAVQSDGTDKSQGIWGVNSVSIGSVEKGASITVEADNGQNVYAGIMAGEFNVDNNGNITPSGYAGTASIGGTFDGNITVTATKGVAIGLFGEKAMTVDSFGSDTNISVTGKDVAGGFGSFGNATVTRDLSGIFSATAADGDAMGIGAVGNLTVGGNVSDAKITAMTNGSNATDIAAGNVTIAGNLSGIFTAESAQGKARVIKAGDRGDAEPVLGNITIGSINSSTDMKGYGTEMAAGLDAVGDLTVSHGFGGTVTVSGPVDDINNPTAIVTPAFMAVGAGSELGNVTIGSYSAAISATASGLAGGLVAADPQLFTGSSLPDPIPSCWNLTVTGAFTGKINARATGAGGYNGQSAAYGVYGLNSVTIGTIANGSEITVTNDASGDAAGIMAGAAGDPTPSGLAGTINIGTLDGKITVKSPNGAQATGIAAVNNLTIGTIGSHADISATGDTDQTAFGIGSWNGNFTVSTGGFAGTVEVTSNNGEAYGVFSRNDLSVNGNLSATIDASGNFAVGLISMNGGIHGASAATPLLINSSASISGNGTAAGAGIMASGPMNLDIAGTVSGSTYSIYSGTLSQDSSFFASSQAVADNVTVRSTATLSGNVSLGGGNDTMTVYGGADISGVPVIDGGDGTDTLTFTGSGTIAPQTVNNFEAVTVNPGVTLAGNGTFSGTTTVANGGILAPGGNNMIGTLTFDNLVLNDSSQLQYDFQDSNADQIKVTGNLTLDGVLSVASGTPTGVYTLMTYDGALTDHTLVLDPTTSDYYHVVAANNEVQLVLNNADQTMQLWNGADGGSSTWSSSSTNWTDPDGSNPAAWAGQVGIFGGTSGTVTVDGTQQVEGLQFKTDGYTLSQGTDGVLQLVGDSATTSKTQSFINVDSGVTATVNITMSGDGIGLKKMGLGTLVLGGDNTYAGNTTVSVGTLKSGANEVIPNGSAMSIASGATFDLNGHTETVGSIAGAGNISLGSGALIAGGNGGSTTFSGVISGNGGTLTKTGTGTLVLTGSNSYSGGTTLSDGVLGVGNNAALGTGNLTMAAGTTLAAAAESINVGNAVTLEGAATVNTGSYSFALSGNISGGSGTLTKTGTGTLVLTGSNSYGGGTSLGAGTIAVGSNGALGSGSLAMANGTTLAASADGLTITNEVDLAGAATVGTGANTFTLSGNILGASGSLTKTGTGTLVLTGSNSYGGGTTVSAGILKGDTTSLQGNISNSASVVFDQNADGTYSGVMSGSGSVVKQGAGMLTLAGNVSQTDMVLAAGGVTNHADMTLSGNLSLGDNTSLTNSVGAAVTVTGNITGSDTGLVAITNAGTITAAAITLGAGNDTITNSGTLSVASIDMGAGDDTMTLTGNANVTGVHTLNGGPGTDTLIFDAWGIEGAEGELGATAGHVVTGWENIELVNGSWVHLGHLTGLDGNVSIDATSVLDAHGNSPASYTINGDVVNSGLITLIDPAVSPDTGDTLTITGNYSGNGTIGLDVDSETGTHDSVNIGTFLSGPITLKLNETGVGPTAGETFNNLITAVNGTLDFSPTAIYDYGSRVYTVDLTYDGTSLFTLNNFTLEGYQEPVAVMQGVMPLLEQLGSESVGRFHERTYDGRDWWVRSYGSSYHLDLKGDAGTSLKNAYTGGMQVGVDLASSRGKAGAGIDAGVFAGTGYSQADVAGFRVDTAGRLKDYAYSLGLYATSKASQNFWIDTLVQTTYHDLEINLNDSGEKASKNVWGVAASIEAGYTIPVSDQFRIEPQAQFVWQHIGKMDLTTIDMGGVTLNSHDSATGRIGLACYTGAVNAATHVFGEINAIRDFSKDAKVSYINEELSTSTEKTFVGGALGVKRDAGSSSNGLGYFIKADVMAGLDGGASHIIGLSAGLTKKF